MHKSALSGFCVGKLDFETVRRLPKAGVEGVGPKVWLALDEVVNPQNLVELYVRILCKWLIFLFTSCV